MVRWLRWHCPPDTGFEIRALAVWGRARYLSVTEAPHNTNFHTWMGKKQFCFFQTAETGNRKAAVLTTTLGPPPSRAKYEYQHLTINPANTKHLYKICTMLDQRRRRWADVVQMLYKCFVFAGKWLSISISTWPSVSPAGNVSRLDQILGWTGEGGGCMYSTCT